MSNCHVFILSVCLYRRGTETPTYIIYIFIYISHHNKQHHHPFKPIMNTKPVGRGILTPTISTMNQIQIPTTTQHLHHTFKHYFGNIFILSGYGDPDLHLICIFIYISQHNKQSQSQPPIQIYNNI